MSIVCVESSVLCTASIWAAMRRAILTITLRNTINHSRYTNHPISCNHEVLVTSSVIVTVCLSAIHAEKQWGGGAAVRPAQLDVAVWRHQADHHGGGTVAPVFQPAEDTEASAQLAHTHTHTLNMIKIAHYITALLWEVIFCNMLLWQQVSPNTGRTVQYTV